MEEVWSKTISKQNSTLGAGLLLDRLCKMAGAGVGGVTFDVGETGDGFDANAREGQLPSGGDGLVSRERASDLSRQWAARMEGASRGGVDG